MPRKVDTMKVGMSGDSLLWNWTRWVWSGEEVGNMKRHIPYEDDDGWHPILVDHAEQVDRLYQALPHIERMIIIAEYPQRHGRFAGMGDAARRGAAARWIGQATGLNLDITEYKLYLGLFKDKVEREVR